MQKDFGRITATPFPLPGGYAGLLHRVVKSSRVLLDNAFRSL